MATGTEARRLTRQRQTPWQADGAVGKRFGFAVSHFAVRKNSAAAVAPMSSPTTLYPCSSPISPQCLSSVAGVVCSTLSSSFRQEIKVVKKLLSACKHGGKGERRPRGGGDCWSRARRCLFLCIHIMQENCLWHPGLLVMRCCSRYSRYSSFNRRARGWCRRARRARYGIRVAGFSVCGARALCLGCEKTLCCRDCRDGSCWSWRRRCRRGRGSGRRR